MASKAEGASQRSSLSNRPKKNRTKRNWIPRFRSPADSRICDSDP